MIKPLAIAGAAVLGTAAVAGAFVLAFPGGEEEEATASATPTAAPTVMPSPTPAPEPSPDSIPADWQTYTDPALGFSFPHPSGLSVSERFFEFPEKNGNPAIQVRTLTYTSEKGLFTLGLAIAPNPNALSLEDWVKTYPGWPGQPTETAIDTEGALLFPIDQQGESFPQIYFRHGDYVFTFQANVYGHQGLPAALRESDFQLIIDEFRLAR